MSTGLKAGQQSSNHPNQPRQSLHGLLGHRHPCLFSRRGLPEGDILKSEQEDIARWTCQVWRQASAEQLLAGALLDRCCTTYWHCNTSFVNRRGQECCGIAAPLGKEDMWKPHGPLCWCQLKDPTITCPTPEHMSASLPHHEAQQEVSGEILSEAKGPFQVDAEKERPNLLPPLYHPAEAAL